MSYKTYRRHNCDSRHRTWRKLAECVWPRAEWIAGDGPYALVARCPHGAQSRISITVTLWKDAGSAEESKRLIDHSGCGGQCQQAHEIVRLEAPHLEGKP